MTSTPCKGLTARLGAVRSPSEPAKPVVRQLFVDTRYVGCTVQEEVTLPDPVIQPIATDCVRAKHSQSAMRSKSWCGSLVFDASSSWTKIRVGKPERIKAGIHFTKRPLSVDWSGGGDIKYHWRNCEFLFWSIV